MCLWIKIRSEDPLLYMFARLCICHNSEHRHFVLFMCLTLEASAVWFIFCRTVYVSEFGAKKLSAFARKPNNDLMKMWASIYTLACIPYHPLLYNMSYMSLLTAKITSRSTKSNHSLRFTQ